MGRARFAAVNLAPEASVMKSTSIDPSMLDQYGIYRQTEAATVFITEREAMRAVKG